MELKLLKLSHQLQLKVWVKHILYCSCQDMKYCLHCWFLGGNQKYVWFTSFWDEKLGVDGWVNKKIPHFYYFFSGDNQKTYSMKSVDLKVAWNLAAPEANLCRSCAKHTVKRGYFDRQGYFDQSWFLWKLFLSVHDNCMWLLNFWFWSNVDTLIFGITQQI